MFLLELYKALFQSLKALLTAILLRILMLSKYRYRWLLNRIRYFSSELDERDPELIVEYAKATGAQVLYQTNGPPRCQQLIRDLDKLFIYRLVNRKRSFLYDLTGTMIMPIPIYLYSLNPGSVNQTTWVDRS